MNGVVSTCGNKRREKKSGVRNALGQETSDVFFYVIKRGVNHQEKYACKALLVRKFILHPLIHTLLEFDVAQDIESQSTLLRFGQLVSTNRTHFLSWPNHQVGFALGAFDRVEFDAFDFVRVEASH
jgi:hypothetical protein